jgi:hypothetical protein
MLRSPTPMAVAHNNDGIETNPNSMDRIRNDDNDDIDVATTTRTASATVPHDAISTVRQRSKTSVTNGNNSHHHYRPMNGHDYAKDKQTNNGIYLLSQNGMHSNDPSLSPINTSPTSTSSSSETSTANNVTNNNFNKNATARTLADRSTIPPTAYLCLCIVTGLQVSGGLWTFNALLDWIHSVTVASLAFSDWCKHVLLFCIPFLSNPISHAQTVARVETFYVISTLLIATSVLMVFFIAPFRAGFWTGTRSHRHQFHRYAGLLYLIQYVLAWIEYLTHYHDTAPTSYLPHTIAVNGTSFISCFVVFQ